MILNSSISVVVPLHIYIKHINDINEIVSSEIKVNITTSDVVQLDEKQQMSEEIEMLKRKVLTLEKENASLKSGSYKNK